MSENKVIFNTRPIERADLLTQGLQAAGYSVFALPLLTLCPRARSAHDELLMRKWCAGKYDVVVVVSPTAAEMALAYWREIQGLDDLSQIVQPSAIIAVGDATASVLMEAGLQVEQPLQANNEGMLQMPIIADLNAGNRVLMWRGLGGRRLLVESLRQRGVEVDSIAWYERVAPTEAYLSYRQWLIDCLDKLPVKLWRSPPIVLISSGASFENWQQLITKTHNDTELLALLTQKLGQAVQVADLPGLADYDYVVLGTRLAAFLHDQRLHFKQVEYLDAETILSALHHL